MDNFEFQKIASKYGEKMAKLCRSLFPGINGVYDFLIKNFEPSTYLYEDLENTEALDDFKNYVYSKIMPKRAKQEVKVESPEILMAKAGYVLTECHSEKEIQKYKKYYASGEELCTFRGGRLDKCRIFFAVKKSASKIKRQKFPHPQINDEYGTSVISIQFDLDKGHMLSIKNRYNHTADDADAPFLNDLDNIVVGLTASFEQYYGLKQTELQGDLNIPNYVRDSNGKFYRYNYEINGVYFCPNNIVIQNGVVMNLDPNKYILMDYFILDLVDKRIKLISDIGKNDNFVRELMSIESITVTKNDSSKTVTIVRNDGAKIVIELDKYNRIIEYSNDKIASVDTFLEHNTTLKKADMPALEVIGSYAFYGKSLQSFTIPDRVTDIGSYAFYHNQLTKIIIPDSVQSIGDYAFYHNQLTEANIPSKVKYIGESAFSINKLTKIEIPDDVRKIGNRAFSNNSLVQVNLPKSIEIIEYDLFRQNKLKKIIIPDSVQVIEAGAFSDNQLVEVQIPDSVLQIDDDAFCNNQLVRVEIPDSVYSIGKSAFSNNEITEVVIPSGVKYIEYRAFGGNKLKKIVLPNDAIDIAAGAFDSQTELIYNDGSKYKAKRK